MFVYGGFGALFSATSRYAHEWLGASRGTSGFSVSIFFVAAVFTRPLVGRIIDRRGRRLFLVVPPFALAALMLAFHFAHSIAVLLAIRFAQGAVGAGFYVAAVAASTDLTPPQKRASAVARLSLALYLGFAIGPTIGELLLDYGPGVAWTTLSITTLAGALICASLPETRSPATADSQVRSPIVHRLAILPGIAMLALGVGYASITAQSALFARTLKLSSSDGLYAAFAMTVLLVRLVSGKMADQRGVVVVVYTGIASFIVGFATLTQARVVAPAVVGIMFVACGWALVLPAQTAWLADRADDAQRGAAVGSLVAFMDIGQGAGGYLVGAIADRHGFGWGFGLPLVLAVAALAVTTQVPKPSKPSRAEPNPDFVAP